VGGEAGGFRQREIYCAVEGFDFRVESVSLYLPRYVKILIVSIDKFFSKMYFLLQKFYFPVNVEAFIQLGNK
jgi:hypothetical protein